MTSKATTVEAYLAELPEDRRAALAEVRKVILANLPEGFEEGMQYGHIGYYVPHSIYPAGYHCDPKQALPFASLASQKNHMAVYLSGIHDCNTYAPWFLEAWEKSGKKLNAGKSCVRFTKLENLPLDVIALAISRRTVQEHIAHYEAAIGRR